MLSFHSCFSKTFVSRAFYQVPVEESVLMLVFGVLDLGIWFIRFFHLVTAHHPTGSKCHLVSFHGRTCVVVFQQITMAVIALSQFTAFSLHVSLSLKGLTWASLCHPDTSGDGWFLLHRVRIPQSQCETGHGAQQRVNLKVSYYRIRKLCLHP